ncbi:MAG: ATP-dependent helicase HrpB [Verrucomicrobiales bacterium]
MPAPDLPIYQLRRCLSDSLAVPGRVRVVVEAPTGSGKSTGVPQILRDDGGLTGEILVLQPRRVAARMLARRVAWERGGRLGGEVGYQIRFERVVSKETRICYLTEGVLVRRLLGDPHLRGVDAVIFDEFHERHVDGDIGLALCARLQETSRPDLKLFVVSATLDGIRLESCFPGANRVFSEGRMYPVTVRQAPRDIVRGEAIWERAAAALGEAVREGAEGDALVFMPGSFEIRKTIELLSRMPWTKGWKILPLFGELAPEKQDEAIQPSADGRRKVVVATNVAETSLTIDGVRIVVDSGLARMADYDPARGLNTLTVQPISRASADQRAGRAGRTAPGLCLRLWSAANHAARSAQTAPEILRLDPSGVLLELLAMGVENVTTFPWIQPPHPAAMERALVLLEELGATDEAGRLTPTGRAMAGLPVQPRLARFLVEAGRRRRVREASLVAALVEGRDLFAGATAAARATAAEKFCERGDLSDFQPALRALDRAAEFRFDDEDCTRAGIRAPVAREVWRLADSLARLVPSNGEASGAEDETEGALWRDLSACLVAAYGDHVAVQISEGTRTCAVPGGRRGKITPECRVANKARLLVAVEMAEVEGKKLEVVLRDLTRIDESLLVEVHPGALKEVERCEYDTQQKRVVRRVDRCFHDVALESKARADVPAGPAAAVLAAEVLAGRVEFPGWDDEVRQWVARLNCLAAWMPELELPAFSDDDKSFVIEQSCLGCYSARDLKEKSPWKTLRQWLSPEQNAALDAYAPVRITLENGREAKVRYQEGHDPEIAMILQRLYDVNKQPVIAGGKVPVVIELLSPAQRPVQKTRDLAAFWKNSYEEVKKQLKGRYPKHEWR